MGIAVFAAAIVLMAGAAAAAEPRLVVVMSFEEPIENATLTAMRDEMDRIFENTLADVDLLVLRGTLEVNRADRIIHIDVSGTCAAKPRARGLARKTLASMYGVDHELQPIGKLDCRAVSDYLGAVTPIVFGRAMARVLAHELYHFVTQRRDHSPRGLFAAGLSELSLTAGALDFSDDDLLALNECLFTMRKTHIHTVAGM
jgi:hypothetical protein